MNWQPSLGAWPEPAGTHFRVWAPKGRKVEVILEGPRTGTFPLQPEAEGLFHGFISDVRAGNRYRYRLDNGMSLPDPASRFQPEGPHGPSQVVDPGAFAWTDRDWHGVPMTGLVIYELHVGTFTPAGTFAAATERLADLRDLGITAVELLPVADFPGRRNWGYDGVNLFAPANCYGTPDDLRRLVDTAHRLGLAVIQDVVYNHLGPDGNYLANFSDHYFSRTHHTGWGAGLNYDGEHSGPVRQFFLQNALHWIHEYHVDGLRLDATHAILDSGPRHFLTEMAATVRASAPDRHLVFIAEDDQNLAAMLRPESANGWGLDGVWADDFHHQVRRFLAGDHESYYGNFNGTLPDLASTIRKGWFYCGQVSPGTKKPRGTEPDSLPPAAFVICTQNHDQVGNRALGERLHHQIDAASYRAATALLLCGPQTPMLFMGQEWAASTPFLFFTDHRKDLGRKVTEGRRREFARFSDFSDPRKREHIPDPQALETFASSQLRWDERTKEPHASFLRLHQALLHLRRSEPALVRQDRESYTVTAMDDRAISLERKPSNGPALLIVIHMRPVGDQKAGNYVLALPVGRRWELVLTTEENSFAPDPQPPQLTLDNEAPRILFSRPGAVLLREKP